MENLKNRMTSPTPDWFKAIVKACVAIAAVGVALLTAETQVADFVLPPFIAKAAQWMVVAGLVGAAIAKTAKTDE